MSIKLKKGDIYLFEWNDTYSHSGWFDEEDIDDLTQSIFQSTTGFLIKETKDWYIVAMHNNKHDGFKPFGNPCWIPKQCVKKISKAHLAK